MTTSRLPTDSGRLRGPGDIHDDAHGRQDQARALEVEAAGCWTSRIDEQALQRHLRLIAKCAMCDSHDSRGWPCECEPRWPGEKTDKP